MDAITTSAHTPQRSAVGLSPVPSTPTRPQKVAHAQSPTKQSSGAADFNSIPTTQYHSSSAAPRLDFTPSDDIQAPTMSPEELLDIPAHRRALFTGDVPFQVPKETRARYPPVFLPLEPGEKAWYVVAYGRDFGVFFDYW